MCHLHTLQMAQPGLMPVCGLCCGPDLSRLLHAMMVSADSLGSALAIQLHGTAFKQSPDYCQHWPRHSLHSHMVSASPICVKLADTAPVALPALLSHPRTSGQHYFQSLQRGHKTAYVPARHAGQQNSQIPSMRPCMQLRLGSPSSTQQLHMLATPQLT